MATESATWLLARPEIADMAVLGDLLQGGSNLGVAWR
jgi:hypothetical protein